MIGIFIPGNIQKFQKAIVRYFFDFIPLVADDKVAYIDFYRTNLLKNEVGTMDGVDFPIHDIASKTSDWNVVREAVDNMLKANDFTTLVAYKSLIDGHCFYKGQEQKAFKKLAKTHQNPKNVSTYVSSMRADSWLVFLEQCSKKADYFYQYMIDPVEASLGNIANFKSFELLYFNLCSRRKLLLMPFYEYMLDNDSRSKLGEQTVPFTFYCTVVGKSRQFLSSMQHELEGIDGWDVNIGTKDQAHRSKIVFQDDYFNMLGQSKCSLVVKPCDNEAFSWLRFCECLFNNCLPLVQDDCSFQDIEGIYPEVVSIARHKLLIHDIDDIRRKVHYFDMNEQVRQTLIRMLKDGVYSKHVCDIQWLRNRWQKLPGLRGK